MLGGELANCETTRVPERITVTRRLEEQKTSLQNNLEEVDNALEILKKNPEIQEVIDTLARLRMY